VKELEKGEVSEVINEDGRLYLLKKVDESGSEVKFVTFGMDIIADPIATVDKQAKQADDFSFFAEDNGFKWEAEQRYVTIREGIETKGNNFITGLGRSQQIMEFLSDAGEGSVSEPLELEQQFVIINVEEVTPAGPQPFDQVKDQIRNIVTGQKRKNQVRAKVEDLLAQNEDLSSLAQATGKEVAKIEGLAKGAASIPGAGREPVVVGAIFGLEQGKRSQPIEGTSAVFVVKLNNLQKAELTNLTPAKRQEISKKLQEEKAQAFMNTWIEQLKSGAAIEDNRSELLRG